MNIAFRTDSSLELGSGHLYRCLSLAGKLREMSPVSVEIVFITKNFSGNFSQLITAAGFPVIFIDESLNENEDCLKSIEILKHHKIEKIIIDNYFLGYFFETLLIENGFFVMVIDDLVNRKHNCHIFLDQNFKTNYNSTPSEALPENCKKFLGPSYSLIRNNFYEERKKISPYAITRINNVLVFFGGSDPDGETLRFLKEINNISHSYHFHLMVSSGNHFLSSIKQFKSNSFTIHIDAQDIPGLMSQCNFYFGSGGGVTWERMCLGLNGAIVIVAENQRAIAEELSKADLQYYWGWARDFQYPNLIKKLDELNEYNIKKINQRTKTCMNLISEEKVNSLVKEILT